MTSMIGQSCRMPSSRTVDCIIWGIASLYRILAAETITVIKLLSIRVGMMADASLKARVPSLSLRPAADFSPHFLYGMKMLTSRITSVIIAHILNTLEKLHQNKYALNLVLM